jgi:DNA polymerase-1
MLVTGACGGGCRRVVRLYGAVRITSINDHTPPLSFLRSYMTYTVLKTEQEVRELIEFHNSNSEYVVVDLETTGLDSFKDEIIDVQISGRTPQDVCILHGAHGSALRALSARPVGHNLRFDITFLFRRGIDLTHWHYHDTMLLAHLDDENRESFSLDALIKEFYGEEASHKEAFWAKYKNYQDAPEAERHQYGARDIMATGDLYRLLRQRLQDQEIPETLVSHVHRLQYALLKTEISGISVDIDYLTNLGVDLKSKIETLRPKMRETVKYEADLVELQLWNKELSKRKTDKGKAGVKRPEFSFESSQQIQTLLYDNLGLPIQYNEKTRQVSTDYASLEKLRNHHHIVGMIQDNRELQKVYGSYIEGTLERMKDGRIYPEFRVSGTKTGRISHSNPNLGQLPSAGGIRGIYIPNDENVFIAADYSQLEVCIEANLTDDQNLKKIFLDGLSKHDITAKELGVDRHTAKTLNFALQYWCTARKVAKLLGVTEHEGEEVWKRYWEIYSGPKRLKNETDGAVDSGEPLVTRFGRRRRFERRKRREFDGDYRQAYNFLIQGTGADLTSRAFYLTSEWLQEKGIGRGLLTVHDELLIEVKADYAQEAEAKMLSFMTQAGDEIGLQIPLKAESSGAMSRWMD